MFVDVHTHLTHEKFRGDLENVISNARKSGCGALVVNGLEPQSNREILSMAENHDIVYAALGIYPSQGIAESHPSEQLKLKPFDVSAEIEHIEKQAAIGKIIAVGECGLDGYWHDKESFAAQEKVFEKLIQIAVEYDLPIIVHSRKLEKRCIEILSSHQATKVLFHCFCGKTKLAIANAEKYGWYFSIPANIKRAENFQVMSKKLPAERILTETDAPYLPPEKGQRNEPQNVVGTVTEIARLREVQPEDMKATIWKNFQQLFGTLENHTDN